jgi:glutamine amidotransferase
VSVAIVDYGSGNLRSVEKSFQRMAQELGSGPVVVTSDPEVVSKADRIVLPGVGAFADCRAGVARIDGMDSAIDQAVNDAGRPFLGICVGMQMFASLGLEHGVETQGFGWIPGEVTEIRPQDPSLKVPHTGWNSLDIRTKHPVMAGISSGDHAYFVHSYQLKAQIPQHVLSTVDYGGPIAAVVGRDTLIGTQFHPEKSQTTGLRLIGNFLTWRP